MSTTSGPVPRIPPKGPSGISPDPPTLDPIRAHALLCAATYCGPVHAKALTERTHAGQSSAITSASIFEPARTIEAARLFETYLRGRVQDSS